MTENEKFMVRMLIDSLSDNKDLLNFSKFSGILPQAIESECVTEVKGKEREQSFHQHFVYEGFNLCVKAIQFHYK